MLDRCHTVPSLLFDNETYAILKHVCIQAGFDLHMYVGHVLRFYTTWKQASFLLEPSLCIAERLDMVATSGLAGWWQSGKWSKTESEKLHVLALRV